MEKARGEFKFTVGQPGSWEDGKLEGKWKNY